MHSDSYGSCYQPYHTHAKINVTHSGPFMTQYAVISLQTMLTVISDDQSPASRSSESFLIPSFMCCCRPKTTVTKEKEMISETAQQL